LLIGSHHQKLSVPQAAPLKIAAVKPAAAACNRISSLKPQFFEKLRRNLRKVILKGIYWILTGL
jgi:hypothetical protein